MLMMMMLLMIATLKWQTPPRDADYDDAADDVVDDDYFNLKVANSSSFRRAAAFSFTMAILKHRSCLPRILAMINYDDDDDDDNDDDDDDDDNDKSCSTYEKEQGCQQTGATPCKYIYI